MLLILISLTSCQSESQNSERDMVPKNQVEVNEPVNFLDSCEQKNSDFEKEQCLIQKAALTSNLSICESQVNPKNKDGCFTELAVNARNPSICDIHVSNSNKCKEMYAINVLDATICPPTSNYCQSTVNSMLERLSREKDDCFPVEDDECYKFLAQLEGEPRICNNIDNEKLKENCKILAEKEVTFEGCSTRMGYGDFRDICYYKLAKQEDSVNYCSYIILNLLKERCLKNFN